MKHYWEVDYSMYSKSAGDDNRITVVVVAATKREAMAEAALAAEYIHRVDVRRCEAISE